MFNRLSPSEHAIKATELPMLAADFGDSPPRSTTSSQLGGTPWWPAGKPYPTGLRGNPLLLLAQINFAETPALDPFPRSGLLQIFIGSDDAYGCSFGGVSEGDDFVCVFHEDLTVSATPPPAINYDRENMFSPLEHPLTPLALTFRLCSMTVDSTDYRLETLLPEIFRDGAKLDAYRDQQNTPPIRLGGYPTFTQDDPRFHSEPGAIGDFALLTVDTTDGVMWGDSGVGQFLIHEDDLRRRDFSRVVYNWDCC